MATYSKSILSGSVDGKQIIISATTSASATPIHTSVTGTSALDEVFLYAYNDATSSIQLSILWGGTTEPNDVVRASLLPKAGRSLLIDGKLLQNALTISAYADIANLIVVDGFVNKIS